MLQYAPMLSHIEISKGNLVSNFRAMKSLVGKDVKIAAVIKANAYGHGQNEVASILENEVDYFQLDDARELELLRKASKKPALIFGYVAKNEIEKVVAMGGIIGVYGKDQIENINSHAKKIGKIIPVHIKIDACLGRQGVLIGNLQEIIDILKKCDRVKVDGVYSHFANIEDTSDFSHASKQINSFENALDIFKENGYENLKTHMSASSGVMVWENVEGKSNLIRPGISLYGMWPSEELRARLENENFKLKPVLRWVSHVAQVKILPENHSVGYGLTYITSKPTKIAVIPQGYSDGYDRGLSNVGEVLIGGTRCPVLGRIAMNMFVVDVDHLENVKVEDEVVLLGKQGNEEITAEEIAAHLGTINYEITTRISPLLPRFIK